MALSETSDEKLFKGDGGRLFEMVQQREIDTALRRMKQKLDASWEVFRRDEELIASGLKSAWENAERDEWEAFRFSTLEESEVAAIVSAEKAVAAKKKSRTQASEEVLAVLRKTVGRE